MTPALKPTSPEFQSYLPLGPHNVHHHIFKKKKKKNHLVVGFSSIEGLKLKRAMVDKMPRET